MTWNKELFPPAPAIPRSNSYFLDPEAVLMVLGPLRTHQGALRQEYIQGGMGQ